MAEQPVEATEPATESAGVATVKQPYAAQLPFVWHRPPAKVVIKGKSIFG